MPRRTDTDRTDPDDGSDRPQGGDPLATFEVEVPDGPERGLRIGCTEHGVWTEFDPGQRSVAFACEDCGLELSVRVEDLLDWRDWGEMC